MKNDRINVFVPKYRKEKILKHIEECLDMSWTGSGFKTLEFENEWKIYTGFKNAHFINSNTSGLHLALRIFKSEYNWDDGDEVLTTPLTFVSTNHAILYENLNPVFCDVNESLCLDIESIKDKISDKTRAIIYVGIGGNIGNYKEVVDLCNERGIKLILDAAHLAGSKINGSQVGLESDVSVFSFQSVKNLPTADSGMICFRESKYDKIVRKMAWMGIDKDTFNRTSTNEGYKWEYNIPYLGFKYNGNSIMASIALVQLEYLDEDNNYRRYLCDLYNKKLSDDKRIKIIRHSNDKSFLSSRHLYQIIVENRDKVIKELGKYNIYPGVHYKVNTVYPMYSDQYDNCPNANYYSDRVISLPLHLNLDEKKIEYICDSLKKSLDAHEK